MAFLRIALTLILPLLFSCGDGGGAGSYGDVSSIAEFHSSSERVHTGQEVVLSARAESADDTGVPGVELSFAVQVNESGSTSGTQKATTDAGGYASVTYQAGPRTGSDTLIVRGPGDASATLKITILQVSVSEFSASPNPVFPGEETQVVVRILDADGYGAQDLDLNLSLVQNRSGADFSPVVLTTDSGGYAFAAYTAGQGSGRDVLRLSVPDGTSTDLAIDVTSPDLDNFSAAPNPVAPGNVVTLQIQLVDGSGNGVADKEVTFALARNESGSETLSHTAATDQAGWARVLHEVGPYDGTDQLYAVISGGTSSNLLDLQVSSQAARIGAVALEINTQEADLAGVTATVTDELGTEVRDVTVNFATTFGRISPASAVTDANGNAGATVTSGSSGRATVTATCGERSDFVYVTFNDEEQNSTALLKNQSSVTAGKTSMNQRRTAGLYLIPADESVTCGAQTEIVAVMLDAGGRVYRNRTIRFSLQDDTGGTLSEYSAMTGEYGARIMYSAGSSSGTAVVAADCNNTTDTLVLPVQPTDRESQE